MKNRGTNSIVEPEFGYRLPPFFHVPYPLAHQALPKAVDAWFSGTADPPCSMFPRRPLRACTKLIGLDERVRLATRQRRRHHGSPVQSLQVLANSVFSHTKALDSRSRGRVAPHRDVPSLPRGYARDLSGRHQGLLGDRKRGSQKMAADGSPLPKSRLRIQGSTCPDWRPPTREKSGMDWTASPFSCFDDLDFGPSQCIRSSRQSANEPRYRAALSVYDTDPGTLRLGEAKATTCLITVQEELLHAVIISQMSKLRVAIYALDGNMWLHLCDPPYSRAYHPRPFQVNYTGRFYYAKKGAACTEHPMGRRSWTGVVRRTILGVTCLSSHLVPAIQSSLSTTARKTPHQSLPYSLYHFDAGPQMHHRTTLPPPPPLAVLGSSLDKFSQGHPSLEKSAAQPATHHGAPCCKVPVPPCPTHIYLPKSTTICLSQEHGMLELQMATHTLTDHLYSSGLFEPCRNKPRGMSPAYHSLKAMPLLLQRPAPWTDLVQLLILPVRPPVHPSPVLLGLPPFSAAAPRHILSVGPYLALSDLTIPFCYSSSSRTITSSRILWAWKELVVSTSYLLSLLIQQRLVLILLHNFHQHIQLAWCKYHPFRNQTNIETSRPIDSYPILNLHSNTFLLKHPTTSKLPSKTKRDDIVTSAILGPIPMPLSDIAARAVSQTMSFFEGIQSRHTGTFTVVAVAGCFESGLLRNRCAVEDAGSCSQRQPHDT
ncbi:uncharacterized protein CLUP02_07927 [Colletotrichum lupini]|uniref:Uncharacterized protein n=1 Tax=Colletotrichum lupini TaxID=145971 RepID=A0A9Q8SRX1_9PEZI|nr:uncharacterized protein CLUP02_07927 [Colletotrichum lupini]UQC82439.1 hypothetical protein CLUP02_07927 [Colletotrichum lupini]